MCDYYMNFQKSKSRKEQNNRPHKAQVNSINTVTPPFSEYQSLVCVCMSGLEFVSLTCTYVTRYVNHIAEICAQSAGNVLFNIQNWIYQTPADTEVYLQG